VVGFFKRSWAVLVVPLPPAAGGVSALLLTRLDDLTALFRTAAR
jgi:hypothetical protein